MLCSKCGVDNEESARFCRTCGAKIESTPVAKSNKSIIGVEDAFETVVTMPDVVSPVSSANSINITEAKKYLLLLCMASATLIVWSIVSRVIQNRK